MTLVMAIVFGLAVTAGMIQPRSLTVLAPLALVLVAATAWRAGASGPRPKASHAGAGSLASLTGVPLALAAFISFALASSAWSPAPMISLEKTAVAIAFATLVIVGARAAAALDPSTKTGLMHAFAIGFAIGAVFLSIEILTRQAITITIVNMLGFREGQINPAKFMTWRDGRLASIELAAMTRCMAAVALLLPAALAAVALSTSGITRAMALSLVSGAALVAIAGSDSQTAKLALVTGSLAAGAACMSAIWARRGLAVVWLSACLAIVPLALLAQSSGIAKRGLDQALPGASPAVRVEILDAYARKVIERPLIGHGVNSSYVLGPKFDAAELDADGATPRGGMRQHPHNVYMQVWFELGAIGAVLFSLIGLAILRAIAAAPPRAQPLACAAFAIVATVVAPSYGMWQYWFMAAIALGAFATTVVAGASAPRTPSLQG